jgi:hypothetical protein
MQRQVHSSGGCLGGRLVTADLPICRFADLPICRFADLPICRFGCFCCQLLHVYALCRAPHNVTIPSSSHPERLFDVLLSLSLAVTAQAIEEKRLQHIFLIGALLVVVVVK